MSGSPARNAKFGANKKQQETKTTYRALERKFIYLLYNS